ncbi:hypothetical protein L195_g063372, partial [Trifolium pratense]
MVTSLPWQPSGQGGVEGFRHFPGNLQ